MSSGTPRRRLRWTLWLMVLLPTLLSCDDNTSPGIQPEITNAPDNFQYQVTAMRDHTRTLSYTWSNSGTQANVNQASVVTAGSATLVIRDADGVEVYSRDLNANGTFTTSSGRAGAWTIRVVLSDATGTLNFRVQRRT